MLEDKEQELPENTVEETPSEPNESSSDTEETTDSSTPENTGKPVEAKSESSAPKKNVSDLKETEIDQEESKPKAKPNSEEPLNTSTEAKKNKGDDKKKDKAAETKKDDDAIGEIDETNAEDAEDADNHHRHRIPVLDYHSMSMENLVGELQRLVRNEKVQAIKQHVDSIKYEFDQKFQEFLEGKKEDFIASGGNEIDFRYNSVAKRQFKEVYDDYREKRNQHYKNLERNHKENLANRLALIEELKGLVSIEEDMNTTYKNFKDIQERWRHAGPVPRTHYNNVWRTYHHHIEIFYDFLHLNRELRDLDFKHNLEEKEKLVEKAEALAGYDDLGRAFRELQTLHKIWKEDVGPVGKEHREAIWERFSNATKALHDKRQEYQKELDQQYEQNLEKKRELIDKISEIAEHVSNSHRGIQQQIKQIQELRDAFFKAGRVPQKANDHVWKAFKKAVRGFNQNKNAFYKALKKEQHDNLDKKRELVKLAHELKDSEEWDKVTPEMKRIQSQWKKIGHVPRKYSDKIWKEFKNACNHYFDRLHDSQNKANKVEFDNFDNKNACLERLKAFELSGKREKDMAELKTFIEEWRSYGRVPFNKKHINQKFDKILDAIFKKLKIDRQEAELLKYGNKIQRLANTDNDNAIFKERSFIRKKINEGKNEIRQLETNLQFFSNASEDNPLVQDVIKKVAAQKEALDTWKAKLKKLNIMEHNLNKETEEDDDDVDEGANSEQD